MRGEPKFNLHSLATAKGFSAAQLTKFGIRNGHGGVVIPYYTMDGQEHIKFQIRTAADGKNNFRWSPGDAKLLPYGLNRPVAYSKQFVWIVEGASDCWTMWLNKQPALGVPGDKTASCLKLEHVEDCTTIAVIQEHDEAGKRFPHRVAQTLYDQGFAGEVVAVKLEYKDARETSMHCTNSEEFHKALKRGYKNRVSIERRTIPLPNINVRMLADITPRPVTWLWNLRIPEGKPCVLAGDGGEGKSFASNGLAAAFTTGSSLPGGSLCESRDVLMWNAEDEPEDTIYGRAEACGAALHRIHILDDVNENGNRVPFTLRHISKLDEYLENHPNINFVIIDPITALLADVDGHTDTEVRGALQPFVEMARRRRVTPLFIMHLKKSESTRVLHRLSGSVAFGALGRSVMYLGTHALSGRKSMDTIKHNLAPSKPSPIEFCITPEGGIHWVGVSPDLDADTIEASYMAAKRGARPGNAVDFLRKMLAEPSDSESIFNAANERSISNATLRQAKETLGVIAYKVGTGTGSRWFWRMPEEAGIASDMNVRHLRAVPSTDDAWTRPEWAQQAIDTLFPVDETQSEPAAVAEGSLDITAVT